MIPTEYCNLVPHQKSTKVKSLFISHDKSFEPQIVFEQSEKILSTIFPRKEMSTILFPNNIHMYVDSFENYICNKPNQVATMLVRLLCIKNYGTIEPELVFGNVLLFSTINPLTKKIDNNNYSIPYYLTEEVTRIYDIVKKST